MPNSLHSRKQADSREGTTDGASKPDPNREWPLIGRSEELALIEGTIDGQSIPGVLLAGAAGTGKSRLATEARALAASRGATSLYLTPTRATSAVPLAAFSPIETVVEGATTDERTLLDSLVSISRASDGLLVAIDNIEHLDRPSMAVVHAAASSGAIKIVGTLRTDENAQTDVVSLWRDLRLRRLEVQALSRQQTHAMLRAGLGGEIDRMAGRMIWEASAGVPLYVRELALEAISQEALSYMAGVWMPSGPLPTPASLRELVELRMMDLDTAATSAAEILAVADELSLYDLAALTDPAVVGVLESSGILHIHDEGRTPIAGFVHPLFGEVLRHSMSRTRHSQISGQLADRYLQAAEITPESRVRVACWQLDAGAKPDPDSWTQAAHEAYRSGDFSLAERLAQAVATRSAGAVVLLAQLHHERGNHLEAEQISATVDLGRFDESHRRRALVQRAVNLFFGLGRGREALELLEPADPANAAWFLLNMGEVTQASTTLSRIEDADESGATVTRIWVDALGGSPQRAIERASEAIGSATPRGILPSRFRDFPELPQALAMLEVGQLDEAASVVQNGLAESVERHPDFIRAWWLFLSARLMLDKGRLLSAGRLFAEGAAIQRDMNQPGLLRWYLGGAAFAYAQSSNPARALPLLEESERIGPRDERLFDFEVELAQSWLMARNGDRPAAFRSLLKSADQMAKDGATSLARRVWFEVARLGGRSRVTDRLSGKSCLDRLRLGFTQSDSGSEFAEVAAGFESLGTHLWAAEAWNAASLAFRKNHDQRSATDALRRASECRGRCEDADTPGLANENSIAPLTEREREVIGLAARGTPSKQIADTLFISVRTVNNLIQRAYTKLGVSSRAEAAVALGIAAK